MDYKPQKKKRVNLHMPDLSLAVEEVYLKMIQLDPELQSHPAFSAFGRLQCAGFWKSNGNTKKNKSSGNHES